AECDGATDALARARDDDALALESQIHASPPLVVCLYSRVWRRPRGRRVRPRRRAPPAAPCPRPR
ncbi:MAG: hypothetical protein ACK55I_48445, partial [bacterium]